MNAQANSSANPIESDSGIFKEVNGETETNFETLEFNSSDNLPESNIFSNPEQEHLNWVDTIEGNVAIDVASNWIEAIEKTEEHPENELSFQDMDESDNNTDIITADFESMPDM